MMPMMRTTNWIPAVFNELFATDFTPRNCATTPRMNIREAEKGYTIELAAPGLTRDELNVHINDEGNLVVKMEQKKETNDEQQGRYLRHEFAYTAFERTLVLPDDVEKDQISARVADGILTLELPRQEQSQVKVSRQIDIN